MLILDADKFPSFNEYINEGWNPDTVPESIYSLTGQQIKLIVTDEKTYIIFMTNLENIYIMYYQGSEYGYGVAELKDFPKSLKKLVGGEIIGAGNRVEKEYKGQVEFCLNTYFTLLTKKDRVTIKWKKEGVTSYPDIEIEFIKIIKGTDTYSTLNSVIQENL